MSLPCPSPVPPEYIGLWRRESIAVDGRLDTRTRVYWLQTGSLYADIRIPPDRPSFEGVTALEQCSPEQRRWLATQEGFAGCIGVDGDLCRWERLIDFQPPGLTDIGRMQFNADGSVTEFGVLADYREEWQPVATGGSGRLALHLEGPRQGIIVAHGDRFLAALEAPAPNAGQTARDRISSLACEISFGRIQGGPFPWAVELSTLPFREGHPLFTEMRETDGPEVLLRVDGELRLWRIIERTPDFRW